MPTGRLRTQEPALISQPAAQLARPAGAIVSPDRAARFCFIDALRGLAALGITLHHINIYGPLRDSISQFLPGWVLYTDETFWIGVQIFFVISGFVIAYSLRNARMTPAFVGNFALRRSIRLDPSYLTVVVIVLVMHRLPDWTGLPSPHESEISLGQILTHGFYLQNVLGYDNLSAGFWTLCIEMQFYLLFCLLLALAQGLAWLRPAGVDPNRASDWATLLVFSPLALGSLWWFNLDHQYENWIIFFFSMFFLGSLVWWSLEGRISPWLLGAYVGLIVSRLGLVWGTEIAVALWAGVTIYVVGRLGHLSDWLTWRPLQYLGRISYSLYLIHYPVSHVVVWFGHRQTKDNPWAACGWTALALGLSIVAAHGLNVLVEAPTARLASRLKRVGLAKMPELGQPAAEAGAGRSPGDSASLTATGA